MFGYPTIDDQWDDYLTHYAAQDFVTVGLVGAVILVVMWRAFGPGSVSEESRRVEERDSQAVRSHVSGDA